MVYVSYRSKGVVACCGYVWRERDTEAGRGEALAWRLESYGWETVGRAQEGSQRPSERVTDQPDVRVGKESCDVSYEVLLNGVSFTREIMGRLKGVQGRYYRTGCLRLMISTDKCYRIATAWRSSRIPSGTPR